jgi:hypothetical protein
MWRIEPVTQWWVVNDLNPANGLRVTLFPPCSG